MTIVKLCHAHRTAAGTLLAQLGLHAGQEMILMRLWREDGQSPTMLAHGAGLQAPTITKMLQRLEAAGIIERRASSSDGRSLNAFLTEKGRALEPAVAAAWNELETRTAADLNDAELEIFKRLLERVLSNLHNAPSNTEFTLAFEQPDKNQSP